MMPKRRSWKEVISKRREENFVGRVDYLRLFSDNFTTEIPTFLLFFVTGEGGVGKSTLLKQFEAASTGPGVEAIAIMCDDEHLSPVSAMGHIAEQLAKLNIRLKEFDERYKTYCARREEIEADPKAPRSALDLVVRGMTDFAIKAARRTPGVGVFAEYVDEKDAGEALAHGVNYLIDRIGNKDEVKLLREPERILTPLFIELLNKACDKHRLVLMFDVFERTREALEPWLLEFLNFEYAEFDIRLTFVISGRDVPDQRWTQIASSICHVVLEPFTQEETSIYLSHRNITNEQLVTQIHEDTGGLPVLVELLAGTNPKPGFPLPDISKDAVKRFLQWIPEEEKRHVALLAAVPRNFNLDILSAALDGNAATSFNWLSVQSYIRTSTTRGWFYHEKVRELMLRYLRNTKPSDLVTAHTRLATFFESQQNQLGLNGKDAYNSEAWRKLENERIYHFLCAQPKRNSREAVNAFLRAFRWRWKFAESVVQTAEQVAHEMASHELQEITHVLATFYHAYDKDEYERLIVQANLLIGQNDLDLFAQATLFSHRADAYYMIDKYEQALVDFDRAIALDETDTWTLALRGETYRLLGKYPEALADLDRAIALDEQDAWALGVRGETYRLMGKYPEALADFDRAIALDEQGAWVLALRGETYRLMGKYPEALADFDRAIELNPQYNWALSSQGQTYLLMERYEEALATFNQLLTLDTSNISEILHQKGVTLIWLEDYDEALANFNQMLDLNEHDATALCWRGEVFRRLGDYERALSDLNLAVQLIPSSFTFTRRAAVLLSIGNQDAAKVDIERVKELLSPQVADIYNYAVTLVLSHEYAQGISMLSKAIALDALARNYAQADDLFDPIRRTVEFHNLMCGA